jgi:hypothetical protein
LACSGWEILGEFDRPYSLRPRGGRGNPPRFARGHSQCPRIPRGLLSSPLVRGLLNVPRSKARGTARRLARQSFCFTPPCGGVAPFGAPSGVFLAAPGRALPVGSCRPASGWKLAAVAGAARSEPRAGLHGPPSASSSRGVVVPPGGAPAPPECAACEAAPAGAGPIPTNGATGSRPLKGSGGREYGPRLGRNYVLERTC